MIRIWQCKLVLLGNRVESPVVKYYSQLPILFGDKENCAAIWASGRYNPSLIEIVLNLCIKLLFMIGRKLHNRPTRSLMLVSREDVYHWRNSIPS